MKTIVLDRADPDIADELADAQVGEEITITGKITQIDKKSATIEVAGVECDYETEEPDTGEEGEATAEPKKAKGMAKMGEMMPKSIR